MKHTLIALSMIGLLLMPYASEARGHGSSSHVHYPNQGGHYAGGHGSSHKGGHYRNARTHDHYTHHRFPH